jgi:LacI family transcriptional regulator
MSSWERVESDLARWVGSLAKPVGVMVCSDQRGSQFLEACRRANALVPDEVAVIGVDDDEPLCEVCNPPLSSVRPGHAQVGFEAASLLGDLMAGRERPGGSLLLEPEGVTTRRSTEVLAIEDRTIAEVLRLIGEHACDGLRIDALAQQVGMSRSVLQRRFRRLLQRTLHEEILHTRLRRARELLLRSDLSLAEIAERSGFKHQEYLGAVCKAHLGKTPARFRKEGRG